MAILKMHAFLFALIIPSMFPQKRLKRKACIFKMAIKWRSYRYFYEIFFLITLQILPFQKFIVGKIFHGWGRRGPIDKTQFKSDLKFVFCYIRPCNFLRKLPITQKLSIKMQNKNIYGFVGPLHTF